MGKMKTKGKLLIGLLLVVSFAIGWGIGQLGNNEDAVEIELVDNSDYDLNVGYISYEFVEIDDNGYTVRAIYENLPYDNQEVTFKENELQYSLFYKSYVNTFEKEGMVDNYHSDKWGVEGPVYRDNIENRDAKIMVFDVDNILHVIEDNYYAGFRKQSLENIKTEKTLDDGFEFTENDKLTYRYKSIYYMQ